MLIYNHKKEFLGIDEADLKILSLSSIADLLEEATDFADLFVKSPGFIHNFKHVHWIDYVTCSDGATDSKAIIKIKGKNYSTTIQINTMYLLESPTQKAFVVELVNLKSLSHSQEERIISSSIAETSQQNIINSSSKPKEETTYTNLNPNIIKDPYEESIDEISYAPVKKPNELKIEIEDLVSKSDIDVKPEIIVKEKVTTPLAQVMHDDTEDSDSKFSNYSYDPHIASEELGLPIDLVEEFIQDFIAQANSFKSDLYNSLAQGNMDNLKIQSHKLKGVAANLRIEDALDSLTVVNSSHDEYEIQKNIDRFYSIINKLSKNGTQKVEPIAPPIKQEEPEDDFVISFKDEPQTKKHIEILDSDVPDFIEIPELADDTFVEQNISLDVDDDSEVEEEPLKVILHYDKNKIAHDIGLDIDSFNELFSDYLIEAKEISVAINESLEKSNLAECKNGARKLKGMSENMRIHDFDLYLNEIIGATNISEISKSVKNITLVLNLISKTEGK